MLRGSTGAALGGTGVSAIAAPTVRLARLLAAQPHSVAVALGGVVRSTDATPGGEARSWPTCPARAGGEAYSKAAGSGEVRGTRNGVAIRWGYGRERRRKQENDSV
jgi:hypothetical protein